MIADRYADAIFQAAQNMDRQTAGTTEQLDSNLADVAQVLADHPDLGRLWNHAVISADEKKALVRQLFAGKIHPLALNLIMLLFDKKRGALYVPVQRAFRERYDATRRRATVRVTSAMALDAQQIESLRHELANRLAKDVHVDTAVDASLIGGLIVQIEDQVIDGSLRGRLENLRLSLN